MPRRPSEGDAPLLGGDRAVADGVQQESQVVGVQTGRGFYPRSHWRASTLASPCRGQRGAASSPRSAVRPARSRSQPRPAIITALSVQKAGLGKQARTPAAAARLAHQGSQALVAGHPAGDQHLETLRLRRRAQGLGDEGLADGLLEAGGDVGAVRDPVRGRVGGASPPRTW